MGGGTWGNTLGYQGWVTMLSQGPSKERGVKEDMESKDFRKLNLSLLALRAEEESQDPTKEGGLLKLEQARNRLSSGLSRMKTPEVKF